MSIQKSPKAATPSAGSAHAAVSDTAAEYEIANRRRPALDVARGIALFGSFALTTASWERAMGELPSSEAKRVVEEQTAHAAWNGFHFLDWGFPAYIILLAASMALSRERRRKRGETNPRFLGRVFLRGALLAVYAFFFYGGFSVPLTQIYFAHYFFLMSACIVLTGLSLAVLSFRSQIVALGFALIGNWAFMTLLPVPGHSSVDFSPEGNALQYVENLVSRSTMSPTWQSADLLHFHRDVIILCGLAVMAYGTCLIGIVLGQVLMSRRSIQQQVVILSVVGFVAMDLALVWDLWFPINKHLWNASFTLFGGGLTLFVYAAIMQVTEVWELRRLGYPFVVLGRYPLAAWTCYFLLPWENFAQRLFGPAFPSIFGVYQPLVIDITQVLLCWLLFAWWDRQREQKFLLKQRCEQLERLSLAQLSEAPRPQNRLTLVGK
jgi:predicted acyltransferase